MQDSVLSRIQALRRMSVQELCLEWEKVFSKPTKIRNKNHLWKRLAWKLQERESGGVDDETLAHIDSMAQELGWGDDPKPDWLGERKAIRTETGKANPKPSNQLALAPGSMISRKYKGRTLVVQVLDQGFLYEGRSYRSLSAIANEVTGTRWNGRLFFGISKR